MTAAQRLLIGVVAGTLIAVVFFPASRSLLIHVFHRPTVAVVLHADPLTRPPGALSDPPSPKTLSTVELGTEAMLIARRAYRDPGTVLSFRDYEIAKEIAEAGGTADPSNAFWPLFHASAAHAVGMSKDARIAWQQAAQKRYWRSESTNRVQTLWRKLAKAEGRTLSWHGLMANSYRPSEDALLAIKTGEARLGQLPVSEEDWRNRLNLVINLGLVRDGCHSVEAASRACDVISRAFQVSGQKPSSPPLTAEQERTLFTNRVGELFGPWAAERISTEWRRTAAWQPLLLTPDERAKKLRHATIIAALAAALPSVLILSGAVMAGIAFTGVALRRILGGIPHPDMIAIRIAALALALVAFLLTNMWLLSVWVLFVVWVLGCPVMSAPSDPITWSRLESMMLRIYAALATALLAFWLLAAAPSTLLLSKTFPDFRDLTTSVFPGALAIGVITFALPFASLVAQLKQRAIFFTLGELLIRIGTWGAAIGIVCGVLLAPICLYADETIKPFAELLTANEVEAYKVTRQ